MNQKQILQLVKKYRWKKFLTRPYDPFFVSVHARAYHHELKKMVNISHPHTIYITQSGFVSIYREVQGAEHLKNSLCSLIKENPKAIEYLLKIIQKARDDMKDIIREKECISKALDLYPKLFVCLTVLPFNIGNFILEKELYKHEPSLKKAVQDFEQYRKINCYKCFDEYLFNSLSDKYSVQVEDLRQLTVSEIQRIVKMDKVPDARELDKRKKQFIYTVINSNAYINSNTRFISSVNSSIGSCFELRGIVVQKGKVSGRVRIVNCIRDINKFSKGDILVSVSANPELMPAIKVASAIITDEGAMMSHAAIIARELRIPCIIGVKRAAKILKEGQTVEVDADNGSIYF